MERDRHLVTLRHCHHDNCILRNLLTDIGTIAGPAPSTPLPSVDSVESVLMQSHGDPLHLRLKNERSFDCSLSNGLVIIHGLLTTLQKEKKHALPLVQGAG